MDNLRETAKATPDGSGQSYFESPDFRRQFNETEVQIAAMEYTELRILGALAAGQNVGPESSMLKTRGSELQQAVTQLAMDISGSFARCPRSIYPAAGDNFQPVGPASANGTAQEYFNTRKSAFMRDQTRFSAILWRNSCLDFDTLEPRDKKARLT